MKKEINSEEVKKLNFYASMMGIIILAAVISLVPLIKFIGVYAFIVYFSLLACALFFVIKAEKIKKDNDIQTYKEILAFTEGKRLDEIQKIQEKAKRPYQKIVAALIIAVIVVLIFVVMALLFKL